MDDKRQVPESKVLILVPELALDDLEPHCL